MKIYTKTGDSGTTSLLGGRRVSKSHDRINAYGTVDELNAFMGLLRDQMVNTYRQEFLISIQERLFTIGASLAAEAPDSKVKRPDLQEDDVTTLEQAIDQMEESLPPHEKLCIARRSSVGVFLSSGSLCLSQSRTPGD